MCLFDKKTREYSEKLTKREMYMMIRNLNQNRKAVEELENKLENIKKPE